MPRLENLDKEKLELFRTNILNTFNKRANTVKIFEPVTYLGAYEELKDDIIRAIPDAAMSISTIRLRKLFYYTNPIYVSAHKMDSMNFGKDFIKALEAYIKLNKVPEQEAYKESDNKAKKSKPKLISFYQIFGVVGLIVIGLVLWKWSKPKTPYYFKENFNKTSLEDLQKRGWQVMDFDSTLFYPQVDSELTLLTNRGDYWRRGNDSQIIKNLFYFQLPNLDCFEINIKLTPYNNFELYQQGGAILLGKDFNKSKFVRFTSGALGERLDNGIKRCYNQLRLYTS